MLFVNGSIAASHLLLTKRIYKRSKDFKHYILIAEEVLFCNQNICFL